MTEAQITKEILRASARGFQSTRRLTAKYGLRAIDAMDAIMASGAKRTRIYGREAGGIGPA